MPQRTKISLVYFISAFALAGVFTFCFFAGRLQKNFDENVYPNIIRLHVVASSNEESEQALKSALKDRVAAYVTALTRFCDSAEEATAVLDRNLSDIAAFSETQARKLGYNGKVETTFREETYTVRTYGAFTFPAGTYNALRITLGEARGKNWWGVLYPNLCTEPSDEVRSKELLRSAGVSEESLEALSDAEDYTVCFYFLELLSKLSSSEHS